MKRTKTILTAILFFSVCPSVFAQSGNSDKAADIEQLSMAFRSVVKKVKPAVVYIKVIKQDDRAFFPSKVQGGGSGVIIDARQGYVLTANHVVENSSQVKVRLGDGREFVAGDIRGDPQTDVALVKIPAENLPEAELGDSDELQVGDWVLAIGSPFGQMLENSVSAGIVSAKGRRTYILGSLGIEDFIQTDAVINKGNSGGPLVNIKGQVVGINSNIISATGMYAGLGFAVPSSLIKPVIEKLIEYGRVDRGWLGVTITSVKDLKEKIQASISEKILARGGAYIMDVIAEAPAEEAGLKAGDIILAIDGRDIYDSAELIKTVSAKSPGEKVKCTIWRDGREVDIKVKLGKRPEKLEPPQTRIAKFPSEVYHKLGIWVGDVRSRVSDIKGIYEIEAVIVYDVEPGSLAEQFQISPGDIITEVNDKEVHNTEDFGRLIEKADVKKGIKLTILNVFGEHKVIIKSGAD